MAAIVRTYVCDDCGTKFDKFHASRDEPPPECPGCQALASKQVPAVFHMNERTPRRGYGNASKAGNIAQDILEKDYGMSDIKDRQREGDLSIVTPPHLRPAVDSFFSASGPIIAAAKQGAQAASREGSNPMTIVQKAAKKRGTDRVPISVVAQR